LVEESAAKGCLDILADMDERYSARSSTATGFRLQPEIICCFYGCTGLTR